MKKFNRKIILAKVIEKLFKAKLKNKKSYDKLILKKLESVVPTILLLDPKNF